MAAKKQWNLAKVKAEEAYGMLLAIQGGKVVDWRDIQVGHIDTGVRQHPAFGVWKNGRSDTLLLEDGMNYKEPGKPPLDPMNYKKEGDEWVINKGHGTRTASVICGYEDGKFKGVAPGVSVIPYRAVNGVRLTGPRTIRVAQALHHAVEVRLCEVVSISLGSERGGSGLRKTVVAAYEKGAIVVAAAGQPIRSVVDPARYGGTIAVGGMTKKGAIYNPYSGDESRFVDVWAPAKPVRVATSVRKGKGKFVDKYTKAHGTSYATAHVAGAAAMWLAYHYEVLDEQYAEPWQRIEAFRTLLKHTGDAMPGASQLRGGTRILDIEALLKEPLPPADSLEKGFNVPKEPDPPRQPGDGR